MPIRLAYCCRNFWILAFSATVRLDSDCRFGPLGEPLFAYWRFCPTGYSPFLRGIALFLAAYPGLFEWLLPCAVMVHFIEKKRKLLSLIYTNRFILKKCSFSDH